MGGSIFLGSILFWGAFGGEHLFGEHLTPNWDNGRIRDIQVFWTKNKGQYYLVLILVTKSSGKLRLQMQIFGAMR